MYFFSECDLLREMKLKKAGVLVLDEEDYIVY